MAKKKGKTLSFGFGEESKPSKPTTHAPKGSTASSVTGRASTEGKKLTKIQEMKLQKRKDIQSNMTSGSGSSKKSKKKKKLMEKKKRLEEEEEEGTSQDNKNDTNNNHNVVNDSSDHSSVFQPAPEPSTNQNDNSHSRKSSISSQSSELSQQTMMFSFEPKKLTKTQYKPNAKKVQPILDAIKDIIGQDKYEMFDTPILNYIVDSLIAQNSSVTRVKESEIIELIATFLNETEIVMRYESASELSKTLMNELYERKLVEKIDEQKEVPKVKVLDEAINLGKKFTDELKKQDKVLANKDDISMNFNNQLDWEKRKLEETEKRMNRKELKEEQRRLKEYEDYLQKRGIANAKGVVRMHRREDIAGTRDIILNNINISVGSRELLKEADLKLVVGRRYGLIGRNGIGKTTLLRHLSEREVKGIPHYLQILHIEQEVVGDDVTALDTILKTDVERERLLQEEKELLESNAEDIGPRFSEIYERMDEIDAHSAEARASSILSGLGFDTEMMKTKTKNFSGGWRMRIALAKALFVEPDVLFLDEPTNHLDLHAVLWLEKYLKSWDKTLVIVSHARTFLNEVATDIVHLNNLKLDFYKGNYNIFEKTRKTLMKQQQKSHEAQQKQRAHIQQFIDKFKYKAGTAKMAQSRVKMLEKMDFIAAVVEDPTFSFVIPNPDSSPAPPYLQTLGVTFGYSKEKVLFKDVDFNVDMDSRIALVGPNGAGKSTFLKVMIKELEALSGQVTVNRKIRIARFSQHHMEHLKAQLSPLEYMASIFPECGEQELRGQLGSFGLSGDKALQPIYTLSGGQKSRVVFAEMTLKKPHLLLLDEPTNHLDLDTIDALINALNEYEGGVVIVSHDEHLIERVCDEIWVCKDGSLKKFNGDFNEYKKEILKTL